MVDLTDWQVNASLAPAPKPLRERRITRATRDVYLKREMQRLRHEVNDILFRVDKWLRLFDNR